MAHHVTCSGTDCKPQSACALQQQHPAWQHTGYMDVTNATEAHQHRCPKLLHPTAHPAVHLL
jgi:hypothetical protein